MSKFSVEVPRFWAWFGFLNLKGRYIPTPPHPANPLQEKHDRCINAAHWRLDWFKALCKQCRPSSNAFRTRRLIRVYTACHITYRPETTFEGDALKQLFMSVITDERKWQVQQFFLSENMEKKNKTTIYRLWNIGDGFRPGNKPSFK